MLRIYWPATCEAPKGRGFLLGWWTSPLGNSELGGDAHDSALEAVVATVVGAPGWESWARQGAPGLTVLGSLERLRTGAAVDCPAELAGNFIKVVCCSEPSRLGADVAKGVAAPAAAARVASHTGGSESLPVSAADVWVESLLQRAAGVAWKPCHISAVQVVEYHQPPPSERALSYLLGVVRPPWTARALGAHALGAGVGLEEDAGAGRQGGIRDVCTRLNAASLVQAAIAHDLPRPHGEGKSLMGVDGRPRERLAAVCSREVRLAATFVLRVAGALCVLVSFVSAWVLQLVAAVGGKLDCGGGPSLLRHSALASQCALRLRVQAQWIGLILQARGPAPESNGHYQYGRRIALINSVFTVWFDVVLGVAVWVLLQADTAVWLPFAIYRSFHWAYGDALPSVVTWLMGVPADFKLNREFTSFLGEICISLFSMWRGLLLHFGSELSGRVMLLAMRFCSLCGLSCLVALCTDLLALASLPLFVAYAGVTCCWRVSIHCLRTLVLLFRCKKYNVLTCRSEHLDFDTEQLLFGVLLLSVFVFLFPSVFMYHACFVAVWLLVLAGHATISMLARACNHLPWFVAMLTFVEPRAWHRGAAVSFAGAGSGEQQQQQQCCPHVLCRLSLRPMRWPADLLTLFAASLRATSPTRPPGSPSLLGQLASGGVLALRHGIALPSAASVASVAERVGERVAEPPQRSEAALGLVVPLPASEAVAAALRGWRQVLDAVLFYDSLWHKQ